MTLSCKAPIRAHTFATLLLLLFSFEMSPVSQVTWQFVANYIISLRFIAQHVTDKKAVLPVGTI